MSHKFTIISFYTIGTGYEKEIQSLSQSVIKLGIPHDIRGINSKGSWEENAKQKPVFIRGMLEDITTPALVWLDADSVVLRYPDIFNHIVTDVAFYFKTTGPCAKRFKGYELITATMYFANNDRTRALIDMWIEEQNKPGQPELNLIEQRALQRVLGPWQEQYKGTITQLPQSYCRIFDAPEDHRVIVQNQASRRLRSAVSV